MTTMFSPKSPRFPKEGRSPPGLLYDPEQKDKRRRWGVISVAVLCIITIYLVFRPGTNSLTSGIASSRTSTSGSTKATTTRIVEPIVQKIVDKVEAEKSKSEVENGDVSDHVFKPIKEPLDKIYTEPESQPSVNKIEAEKKEVEAAIKKEKPKKKSSKSKTPAAPARESWAQRPELDDMLAKVISMIPDEVLMRELTREIEVTGKERMREMGLRTRAYKKYFDAWEELHRAQDTSGETYLRDDIIQYLRSRQTISQDSVEEDGIEDMNIAQTIRSYEAYRAFIKNFGNLLFPWTTRWFGDHMALHTSIQKGGRGIVLTAGDDQAPYLLTTIHSYRKLGCTLPIEVMYLGDQDLDEDYRAELEALPGVITRDLSQMTEDKGWKLAGWAAKPFAILLSSFREVIFIDADALFFRNPEILFSDPDYVEHGALFFKDRIIMPENKKRLLQQMLPKPVPRIAQQSRFWTGESGHQMESGVVVVDKYKHFLSMLLVTRFNGPDRDGNKEKGITGVYDLMYGDKETFWLGFLLAGDESFAFHAGDAAIMGTLEPPKPSPAADKKISLLKPSPDSPDVQSVVSSSPSDVPASESTPEEEADPKHTICAPQILHLSVGGEPLWFNGWLLHNKFADKGKKKFANFDYYLIEPRETRDPTPWQLAQNNLCCLTSDDDKLKSFSEEDRGTLQMIKDRATVMGMGDQST